MRELDRQMNEKKNRQGDDPARPLSSRLPKSSTQTSNGNVGTDHFKIGPGNKARAIVHEILDDQFDSRERLQKKVQKEQYAGSICCRKLSMIFFVCFIHTFFSIYLS